MLDQADELAELRSEFQIPQDVIYLDGNSLGPLMRAVGTRIARTVTEEWGNDLITSWNDHDWINLPTRVGDKIGRLIGAAPGQLICTDSVSVNVFKVLAAALALRPERHLILSTENNFPTDLYIAEGLAALEGNASLALADPEAIPAALSESVAVVMLTEVDFRTGRRLNMAEINAAAHACGALVIWDLSHSVGAVPINLDQDQADFAVGCGYKFLNGGPGAPAFLYVAERHQQAQQPITGWMGHASPFSFVPAYEPAADIRRFSTGTIWQRATIDAVQRKSVSLASIICECVENEVALAELSIVGPGPGANGGSQISMSHPKAYEIVQALIERGVIGDFREPDIVRFGLCPLFLSHSDVFEAMTILVEIMTSKAYLDARFSTRSFVT
jgi:kynureninase